MLKRAIYASVGLTALSLATLAHAQTTSATPAAAGQETAASPEEQAGVGDIVVTAQRREQSLLSVPVAISAIGGEELVRKGIADTSQLAASVPNIQVNSAFGKTQPNFTIRGIGVGNEFNSNQASPVGVYIDDAYIASRTSQGIQLYDLQRVEVLRGPQGTLFGRNTTGGAISIVTNTPSLGAPTGYLQAGYGNYNAVQLQGALEFTPVEGVLGIRAVASYDRSDETFRNVQPGKPGGNGGETISGRIAIRFDPTDTLRFDFKAYGGKSDMGQTPFQPIGVNGITGYSRAALGLRPNQVDFDKVGYKKDDAWGFLLRGALELSNAVTLNLLTSYDGGSFDQLPDGDGTPANLFDYNPRSWTRQFNQEVRVNYSDDRVDLVVGGYYGTDTNRTHVRYGIFPFLEALGAPVDFTGATGGFTVDQRFNQFRRSIALFSQLDYKLSDQLTVTVGGRYTWDKAEMRDALAYFGGYNYEPLFYSVTDPNNPGQPVPDLTGRSSAPTARLALTYTFDNQSIIYASYNHGYRAGTFTGGAYVANSQLAYVKPEKVHAFEIGTKGKLLDNLVSYSLNAFYMSYRDQQTQETLGFVSFLRNAGKATIYGGELELTARPARNLTMRGSLGYLHTRYDELLLGYDPITNTPGVDLAGNELPFAPKFSLQAGADWEFAQLGSGTLSLSPQLSYVSRQWFTPYNARESFAGDPVGNRALSQDGYALVDGSLTWSNERLMLKAWVKNLTQTRYNVFGLYLRNLSGSDTLTPAEPRTYGVSARLSF